MNLQISQFDNQVVISENLPQKTREKGSFMAHSDEMLGQKGSITVPPPLHLVAKGPQAQGGRGS